MGKNRKRVAKREEKGWICAIQRRVVKEEGAATKKPAQVPFPALPSA